MSDNVSVERSHQAADETLQIFAELRAAFNLNSDSAVIRRALGLARFIAKEAKDDHTITIERKDGTQVQLLLDA